ncbi:MAG: aminotransferase class I/II-fold pyridoxal phosphate-dependent enzyme, partial [bacterium]
ALISALKGVNSIDVFSAEGGMFVVFDVRKMGISSQEFARGLLDQFDVAVLPCDGFGPSGKGLIRVSLCVPEQQLVVAAGRIVEYVESIRTGLVKNEPKPG